MVTVHGIQKNALLAALPKAAQERLPDNQLIVTQELIASMLGVRREGITEAARKLQRQGVITYHRGTITVIDRPRLERMSCECYAVVRKETDRLLQLRPLQPGAHRAAIPPDFT